MATTLVAVFDSVSDAERARSRLLESGISAQSAHITDNESLSSRGTTADTGEHRGFFARLFGLDDSHEHTEQYSRAIGSGSALLTVTLEDESQASRVQSLLNEAGAVDIDERSRQQGATGKRTGLEADRAASLRQGETFEVVQEELQVGKRDVETGGVRVRQYVTERPVHEQIRLCEERAIVERRPVDRAAGPQDLAAMKDREIEIREHAEQAVVGKTARVVEEVRVGKEAVQHTENIDDTVRRTDVDVEQLTARDAARRNQTQSPTIPPRR